MLASYLHWTCSEATQEVGGAIGLTGFDSTALGLVVEYDIRDNARNPTQGRQFDFNNLAYRESLGGDQSFDVYQSKRFKAIQGYLVPFSLPGVSLTDFKQKLYSAGVEIPSGYRLEYSGETKERAGAQARMMAYLLPLITLMIATVVMTFNSFPKGGIIALVACLSSGLAFLSL